MILGIIIGVYAEDGVRRAFKESAQWDGVSIRMSSPVLISQLMTSIPSYPRRSSTHDLACSRQSSMGELSRPVPTS